jgi:Family of unknown function (DUF6284)
MFSMPHHVDHLPAVEPTARELRAIETEWPVIEADLFVLDAEISFLSTKRPSELDWRRLRRAEAHLTRALTAPTTRPARLSRPSRLRAA